MGANERGRSLGLPKLAIAAFVLGAIALSLTLLKELRTVIAPTFLAINLLIAAFPVYTFLTRRRTPGPAAAIVTGLVVLLVFMAGIGAIIWSGTAMVQSLTAYGPQFTSLYTQAIEWLAGLGFDQTALFNQLKSISPTSVIGAVGNVVSEISGATGLILVVLIAMVFMVMDLPTVGRRFAVTNRLHPDFTEALDSLTVGIRRYWLVTSLFGIIVALIDGVVLIAVGVPLPLVWVILSFITNYIPNIGFVIGLLPPALLAMFEKGPWAAVIVVVAYSVINFVIQSIIQPKFTGDAVGVSPTVSFLSLLLWTAVFGALGALLALPLTLTVKALLIDNDPKARWVGAFLASDPDSVDTSDCDGR
ncbi:MAG: AI-2E family transporter [Propionibacteriaceae bacterium]|nr:AI-2E family transporter [Propionibacteriaceae bacterium]